MAFDSVNTRLLRVLTLVLATLAGTATLWALPAKGTPAPPLDSLMLLQAPAGAKADWASLKGKVVVLEFWATWCSPCVASLPHINQLIESLDSTKFQFLSIDDEDQKSIQTFLNKKKPLGWFGVDAAGSVYAAYGISSRPTTVIVDGNGKIVAITEIDSVSAADLQAVAEGKDVAFKPASAMTIAAPLPVNEQTLFSVSLSKASPNATPSTISHPPTGTDFLGSDADGLLVEVLNPFHRRYVLKDPLPTGRYDLRVNFVDVPHAAMDSAMQQAVLSALHLQIQQKTITRKAYILRATEASKKLLSPSASTRAVKRGYWHGIYILMNGTIDDLIWILSTGLEAPIINETGIDGTFDARFSVQGNDVESLNGVLKTTMGLELVTSSQELPITVLEVSRQEAEAPSTQAPQH